MRLFKDQNIDYVPFHKSVQDIAVSEVVKESANNNGGNEAQTGNMLEKYSYLFQTFISFEKETEKAKDTDSLFEIFKNTIKRIIPIKDASILFFDDNQLALNPIEKDPSSEINQTINGYFKEGVLNLLFDKPRTVILPHLNTYYASGSKMNYVLIPIFEEGKKKGVLAILTTASENLILQSDKEFIEVILRICLSKIDRLTLKGQLNGMYEELQTYQAKLSNDFRLAAIGELTEGIVDDIVSPLQVIMSQVDMLNDGEEPTPEIKRIKAQVTKVNNVISRLVKFASMNQKNVKIQPCNLNEVIEEYYNLVKSSLISFKLECVLDFEKNIPPILSHPNYIHQILANVFGLIKSMMKDEVGILLQTRHKNDAIILKVISTSDVRDENTKKKQSPKNSSTKMTIKIIENLMKKHEGTFFVESFENSGSQITLTFPLKRKIRV